MNCTRLPYGRKELWFGGRKGWGRSGGGSDSNCLYPAKFNSNEAAAQNGYPIYISPYTKPRIIQISRVFSLICHQLYATLSLSGKRRTFRECGNNYIERVNLTTGLAPLLWNTNTILCRCHDLVEQMKKRYSVKDSLEA